MKDRGEPEPARREQQGHRSADPGRAAETQSADNSRDEDPKRHSECAERIT